MRHRLEDVADFRERGFAGRNHRVEAPRHLQQEARFARLVDSLREVARSRRLNNVRNFILRVRLHGAVEAFDHAAKPCAGFIEDGIDGHPQERVNVGELQVDAMLVLEVASRER